MSLSHMQPFLQNHSWATGQQVKQAIGLYFKFLWSYFKMIAVHCIPSEVNSNWLDYFVKGESCVEINFMEQSY